MDKEVARALLSFVNDAYFMDSVNQYVNSRLGQLHKQLEQADLSTVGCIQGQIKELKRLISLQEEVRERSK